MSLKSLQSKLILFLFLCTFQAFETYAQLLGTYTINAFKPATTTNYKSFLAAVGDLYDGTRVDGGPANGQGVKGAVTFLVADGIYNEYINIGDIFGSTPASNITFISESNDSAKVILTWASSIGPAGNAALNINAKNISFKKITIERSGNATYGNTILIGPDAGNITISNCRIRSGSAGRQAGILSSGAASDIKVLNNHFIHGNIALDNTTGTANGLRIEGNIIERTTANAISVSNAASPVISGNRISEVYGDGSLVIGIKATSIEDAMVMKGNWVTLENGTGIYLTDITGSSIAPALFANNMVSVWDENNMSLKSTAVYISNTDYLHMVFNSLRTAGTGNGLQVLGLAGNEGNVLLNNALLNTEAGYSYLANVNQDFYAVSDYNSFYSIGSANNINWNGTNYFSISSFQAASGTDAHSVGWNPDYISATDLHSMQPELDGSGVALSYVNTDIDGEPRHALAPDIGADEMEFFAADLSVIGIISPVEDECGNDAMQVRLVVLNKGLATQSNFNVYAALSGDVSDLLIHSYSKTLKFKEQDTITFSKNINTQSATNIFLAAYTGLPADSNRSNDTLDQAFLVTKRPSAPVAEGTTVCKFDLATLTAQSQPDALLRWYDSPQAVTALGEGEEYTTPGLSQPAAYYVSSTLFEGSYAGPSEPWLGKSVISAFTEKKMKFTVHKRVLLDSIDAFPVNSGTIGWRILAADSQTVLHGSYGHYNVSQSGQRVRIPVSIWLDPGTYWVDAGGSVNGGLFSNVSATYFPYEGNEFITMDESSDPGGYYYFYNWKLSSLGCESPRTKVQVDLYTETDAFFTSEDMVCAGEMMHFQNESAPSTGMLFYWTFGDGGISSAENPVKAYTKAGIYEPTLLAIGADGCIDTFAKVVEVAATPVPIFATKNNCLGEITIFENLSTIDSGYEIGSVFWDFGNGQTSTAYNPGLLYGAVGNYNVLLRVVSKKGCRDSIIQQVTITLPPQSDFNITDNGLQVTFEPVDDGLAKYEWNFGDGFTTESKKPTHNYVDSGVYIIRLRVTNAAGCASSTTKSITVKPSGMESGQHAKWDLKVYPNPVANSAVIEYELIKAGHVRVELMDITGKTLLELAGGNQPAGSHRIVFDNGSHKISPGSYLLKLVAGGSAAIKHVVILNK